MPLELPLPEFIRIDVCMQYTISRMLFLDHTKAKVAYDTIKKAADDWDRYNNKQAGMVEVDTYDGLATFRVEYIQTVLYVRHFDPEIERDLLRVKKAQRDMEVDLGLLASTVEPMPLPKE